MTVKRLITAIAIIGCLLANTGAQTLPVPPRVTGLALEVTFLKDRAPAYEAVPRVKLERGVGSWYGLFGRVAGWQLPVGAQLVNAVRVTPYLDGDTVRVTVSVLRGEFLDIEETVGTYGLRRNEEITVDGLKDFGVEPFRIKVIKMPPQPTDFPSIVNETKSLEVVGVEPILATFPHYKLTLHNVSEKNISAVSIYIKRDGKVNLSGMSQGDDGEPFVRGQSFGELSERLVTRAETADAGYVPVSPRAQEIIIAGLVFEDGSYEGEVESAATYRGYVIGRKTELKRIVPVLENALATSASSETLLRQLNALSHDFDNDDIAPLAKAFPGIDRKKLGSSVEAGIHRIRKELFDQLETFKDGQHSEGDFQVWLMGIKERYSRWLSRLERHPV